VTKQVESAIEGLRVNSLSALGLAERRAEKVQAEAKKTVPRSTPKARVSLRRRTVGGRKVRQTTLTLQAPASHAS